MGLLARLGIRSPEQTTPATPPAGQRTLYAKTTGWYDLDDAGVESPIGAPIPTNYLAPTGAAFETFPRNGYSAASGAPGSGTLFLVAIALPAGVSVGRIAFVSTTTGANTPTHWWFGLYDQNRVQLATTADQLTAAWAAATLKSVPIATTAAGAATTYTTTYTGLHYLGYMMTATTTPNLACVNVAAALSGAAPVLCGTSNTAQTTPQVFPFTAAAIAASTNLPYAYVGP